MNCEEFVKLGRKLKGMVLELYAGNGDYEDDFEMLININDIIDDMSMSFEYAKDEIETLKKKSFDFHVEKLRLEKELKELKGEAKES